MRASRSIRVGARDLEKQSRKGAPRDADRLAPTRRTRRVRDAGDARTKAIARASRSARFAHPDRPERSAECGGRRPSPARPRRASRVSLQFVA